MVKRVIFMFIILLPLFIAGCSGKTYYTIMTDFLSFFEAGEASFQVPVPANEGIRIYLLPGIQIAAFDEDADEDMRLGYHSVFDSPVSLEDKEFLVAFSLGVVFSNLTSGAVCSGGSIEIYMSEDNVTDIYTEGILVSESVIPQLDPGGSGEMEVLLELDSSSEYYPLVEQGDFRTGIRIILNPHISEVLTLSCEFTELALYVSTRPFQFIPSEEEKNK